jgi:uncharacterized membrane protein
MFRPFYNGHLQASILGGAANTTAIRNVRDIVSRVKTIAVVLDNISTDTFILVIVYEHNGNVLLEHKDHSQQS